MATSTGGTIGNRYDGLDVPGWVWGAGVGVAFIALIIVAVKLFKT